MGMHHALEYTSESNEPEWLIYIQGYDMDALSYLQPCARWFLHRFNCLSISLGWLFLVEVVYAVSYSAILHRFAGCFSLESSYYSNVQCNDAMGPWLDSDKIVLLKRSTYECLAVCLQKVVSKSLVAAAKEKTPASNSLWVRILAQSNTCLRWLWIFLIVMSILIGFNALYASQNDGWVRVMIMYEDSFCLWINMFILFDKCFSPLPQFISGTQWTKVTDTFSISFQSFKQVQSVE